MSLGAASARAKRRATKTLATASFDGTAKLWDAATGAVKHTLAGHKGVVMTVAVSPDGKTIATGGIDTTIRLWDAATGKETNRLDRQPGHRSWVNALVFTPDGKHFYSAGSDNSVLHWWLTDLPHGGRMTRIRAAEVATTST